MLSTKEEKHYGYRRITVLLNKRNIVISEKTMLKYMQKLNLKSKTRLRKKQREDKNLEVKKIDLINSNWTSDPNKKYITTPI